jgi:hypothetical protein
MSSISGLGTSIVDVVPYTTQTQSSTEDNPASLNDEALYNLVTNVSKFTQSSNSDYLLNNVNQSIYSGNAADVQSAIDTYTQSLPNSAVYDSPYTAPSAQFLKDLTAIKNDASSGNLAAAAADFQTAKSDSPENTTGGISAAYEKHDTSAIAAIALEGTVNTAHYLASQGLSTADANAQAIAFTVNSVVDHGYNTAITAQTQTGQITDLATSLAKTEDFTQTESIPTSSTPLFDIVKSLFGATVSTSDRKQAYALNNQLLASFDATYGSNTSSVTGGNASVQTGTTVSTSA